MSAIFGILRFDGGEVSPRDLERIGNRLAPRGPDGRAHRRWLEFESLGAVSEERVLAESLPATRPTAPAPPRPSNPRPMRFCSIPPTSASRPPSPRRWHWSRPSWMRG